MVPATKRTLSAEKWKQSTPQKEGGEEKKEEEKIKEKKKNYNFFFKHYKKWGKNTQFLRELVTRKMGV